MLKLSKVYYYLQRAILRRFGWYLILQNTPETSTKALNNHRVPGCISGLRLLRLGTSESFVPGRVVTKSFVFRMDGTRFALPVETPCDKATWQVELRLALACGDFRHRRQPPAGRLAAAHQLGRR